MQKHRDGRVADVHGADAAVGVVLLGKQRHLPAGRGDELVRGEGMPPARVEQRGVIVAARGLRFARKAVVQRGAAGEQLVEMRVRIADGVGDLAAVAAVPGFAQVAEIVDRSDVVIGDDPARFAAAGQRGRRLHAVAGGLRARTTQVQVAPVDGHMVAGMAQRLLGGLAAPGCGAAVQHKVCAGHGRADVAVVAQPVGQVQPHAHVMRRAVGAFGGERDQRDRHAQHVGVVGQGGRYKAGGQPHAAKLADKAGAGGADLQFGQRGFGFGPGAKEAAGLPVHGHGAAHRFGGAAPVAGVGLGHGVGGASRWTGTGRMRGAARRAGGRCRHGLPPFTSLQRVDQAGRGALSPSGPGC